MLKYYKQEIRDLRNPESGKVREVYKVLMNRSITAKDFMGHLNRHSQLGAGVMDGAMYLISRCLTELLAKNGSVTIPDIGTFSVGIRPREGKGKGLIDPNAPEDGESHEINALSIEVDHINFRPNKRLLKNVRGLLTGKESFTLEYGHEGVPLYKPYLSSRRDRFKVARQYLSTHHYMHISDYAALTGLSYSSAQRELSLAAELDHSGIISDGRRSHRIYILRPADEPQTSVNEPQAANSPQATVNEPQNPAEG